jgi:acetamidase/formamidase
MAEHELDRSKIHFTWNPAHPPALTVDPGDVVHCWTQEVTNGQVTRDSGPDALAQVDLSRIYPLAGPIAVHGAQPGDALEIEILSLKPDDWGWTGILPGLGLLAEEFTQPYIKHFDLSDGKTTRFDEQVVLPLQPFCGTMGVAPAEPGDRSVLPPGDFGGNMDIRHLNEGCTLLLPVNVEGALFSAGDCHAVQGDGEVCVTGIECPMSFSLRFGVRKGTNLPSPQFMVKRSPVSDHDRSAGYYATTGVGPDLMEDAQNAVRRMIDWLGSEHHLAPEEAYLLSSLAGDLKISEIVDQPNWIVSFYMPLTIFGR